MPLQCLYDNTVMELMRGIRNQLTSLVTGLEEGQLHAMALGLSHRCAQRNLLPPSGAPSHASPAVVAQPVALQTQVQP